MKLKATSCCGRLLYFWCCLFMAQVHVVRVAATATTADTSPVSNWDPSWTASCVQSTIAAVTCSLRDDDSSVAVVVLISSSGRNNGGDSTTSRMGLDTDNWVALEEGLRVKFHRPDQVTTLDDEEEDIASMSRRWTLLGPSTVACMTGLASDVDYLTRVLQKQVETHRFCYEGSRIIPTMQLVRKLQKELREAAVLKEGRPFGIQALMVGCRGPLMKDILQQPQLDIFSLDPSGGYRHWGSAAAIGKKADIVRKRLYDSLSSREEKASSLTAHEAIDVAISSLLQRDLEYGKSPDMNVANALLIWTSKGRRTVSVASIDPRMVASRVKNLIEEHESS